MKILAITALLALAPLAAQAAELVVVDARGVELKVGQTLDGAAPVTLPEGARLSLVSSDGTTITLKGPFTGAPAGGGPAGGNKVVESLATLVAARAPDATAVGAARAVQPGMADAWQLDATAAGNACVRQGQPVTVTRPVAVTDAELVVAATDRSWNRRVIWPTAQTELTLPGDLPLADRQTVTLALDGRPSVPVTVHLLPASLTTDAMRSAFLAARGCDRQLRALAAPARP
ncbi:MAG TPA: hypothetical protein VED40_02500 [Azospirillaceae bacterium]|nr:hypothetical protein [Azospirillaceae bacterium]